jgi:hypothetical protein
MRIGGKNYSGKHGMMDAASMSPPSPSLFASWPPPDEWSIASDVPKKNKDAADSVTEWHR